MAKELEVLCRQLRLSDHEKNKLLLRKDKIQQSKKEAQFSLLFKLLTTRSFNGDAFKGTIRNLWASPSGFTIHEIDDNLFMVVFQHKDDLERVFVRSPWTFDKKLIQLVQFEANMQSTAVKFTHSTF